LDDDAGEEEAIELPPPPQPEPIAEFAPLAVVQIGPDGQVIYETDEGCNKCGGVGELLLCETCPKAFHVECVGLTAVPEGDWFCDDCGASK
jgi:hypothetical protein